MLRSVIVPMMVALMNLAVAVGVQAAATQPAATQPAAGSPAVRVLMFVGGLAHDFEAEPHRLAEALGRAGDLRVRVSADPADLSEAGLADVDVMAFNCCIETGLAEPQRKAILDALARKKGLVLLHCAVWSFQDWPAWRDVVGGAFDRHDAFGPFESVVVHADHPIVRGLPGRFALDDEAYTMKDFTGIRQVLVLGVEPHGGHAAPEPFVWTSRYLGARVVTILYGHDARSQGRGEFRSLLANGLRWAAGRLGPATVLGDVERRQGFVPLFDARTPAAWRGDEKLWEVKDGLLVGRTPSGWRKKSYAIFDGSFGDFVLRAEIRVVRGNSGVQFRSREGPGFEVAGYQADAAVKAWGNLHEQNGRRRLVDGWWHKGELVADLAGWNELEITARGDRIILGLNGVVTADYTEKDPAIPRGGLVALQLHDDADMEVHFANIRIRPLSPGETLPSSP